MLETATPFSGTYYLPLISMLDLFFVFFALTGRRNLAEQTFGDGEADDQRETGGQ